MMVKKIKQPFKISPSLLFVFMLGMMTCSLWGQVSPKKLLKEEDFKDWAILREPSISNDGDWITYPISYLEQTDTLVVMNPKTNITYKVAEGSDGKFAPDNHSSYFVFKKENKGVGVIDLKDGSIIWAEQADYYEVSASGTMVVCVKNNDNKTQNITILNLGQTGQNSIEGITDFALSPTGTHLAYSINRDENSEILVRDGNGIQYSYYMQNGKHFYHNIVWKPQGDAISFMDRSINRISIKESESIVSWNMQMGTTKILHAFNDDILSENEILPNLLFYSDDGNKLIFNITPITDTQISNRANVQEWKGTDPWVYPRVQTNWKWKNQWWKTAWWPETNKLLQIGNEQTPEAAIAPNQKYAMVYSQVPIEPQYTENPTGDFYILNLETGDKNIIAKQVKVSSHYIKISPGGKYISFFKDKQWWVYDIKNKTNTCITCSMNTVFYSKSNMYTFTSEPCGNPGWTIDDKEILIYDQNDLWAMTSDGKTKKRLTNGQENNISFRIDNANTGGPQYTKSVFQGHKYDITNHPLLFSVEKNEIPFAYYSMGKDFKQKLLVKSNGKISVLRKANSANSYIFSEESAEDSPSLWYLSGPNPDLTKVYQSNPQKSDYLWGITELLNFTNSYGQNLNAVLRYPDNFEKGKRYPMVVYIYEKRSHTYCDFITPTYYEDSGFNSRIYTANGYFVLEPDITYVVGAPGFSAVDCVTSAVNTVLDKEPVDKDRIGLIGHSYGGYETAFIITQTDMFKAAVAGAAVTDLTSFYFSISKDYQIPDLWRFEDQQWRMKNSFFSNKDAYNANSPIQQANKINTPLLLWTGENDGIIPPTQSVELYLALRRLRKKVSFLLYPGEDHALLLQENQKDLSQRIKVWFDTYLN